MGRLVSYRHDDDDAGEEEAADEGGQTVDGPGQAGRQRQQDDGHVEHGALVARQVTRRRLQVRRAAVLDHVLHLVTGCTINNGFASLRFGRGPPPPHSNEATFSSFELNPKSGG